ncbi:MAG TPA: NAD(P)/FAD-dependent oxidoreductase [Candidatus Sulfotelmatobacter sp.]|jgi:NADH dehydrogenase|nr:NAD(P)/FAD-dependent oxidoreductase [Candidatus Sulfotelmatobacter sp.]
MIPRVIIVGGGFGGLYAARALQSAPVYVTLIDKRNYHLFRPMLYQVATGLLSGDEIAGPLRSILSRQKNLDVLLEEVTGINSSEHIVHLRRRDLPYDFLILATGIQYNYFGHDEWRQFAPGLESLDDADVIRGKILLAFERAEEMASSGQASPGEIERQLTFALVGAGTVGVEMASTLAEMSRMALAHEFRHIDPAAARICLYEAAPRILPTFPEHLSIKARQHLESLGVSVFTNARVTAVDSAGIVVNGQRVLTATVLWGAGVVASPAGRWLNAPTDKSGKIIVEPDLSVPGHRNVFAIGDTAHVVACTRNLVGIKSRTPVVMPGVAQPAIQEGKYVADVIRLRTQGRPAPAPFWYWDKGDLAIVGRTYAVADLRFVRFAGFPAWLLWVGVHIYFLIGFANRLFVLLQWGFAFLTKRRQVRVFSAERPSVQNFIDPAA